MEYKFRGLSIKNNKWLYGNYAEFINYLDGKSKPGIQIIKQVPSNMDRMISAFETELVEAINGTIGQYTGLKDENGVDIYDGDIIKYDKNVRVVHFKNGSFGYTSSLGDFVALKDTDLDWVVIGNIYEHKHLLKEE